MGDYNPPSTDKQVSQALFGLRRSGPKTLAALSAATRAEALPNALTDLGVYGATEPGYFNIGEILQDIAARNAVSRDLETVRGGGRELAGEAISLDQLANPEFYANRATASKGFSDLISGQDPNKLSGAETANLERGINRLNANAGVENVGDATTTASNALLFDDRLQNKRDAFARSLSLFPGIQSGSQSGINTYQIAAGRGSAIAGNPSINKSAAPQQFGADQFFGNTTQGAFGLEQNKQNIKANRRDLLDRRNEWFGATGSVCCFIFLEAYNGKLPWYVRMCRDVHYERHPELGIGYKRMAKWLVPLMRKSKIVSHLVNTTMVKPISRYGRYLVGLDTKYNPIDKFIRNTWFKVWRILAI